MINRNICYLFLHKPYGRGSGRYQRYILDYFKLKNTISLVAGMEVKQGLLEGIDVRHPKISFEMPVYQGRTDVKDNILLSKINDTQFNHLINAFKEECVNVNNKQRLDIVHANHCSILPYSAYLAKKETGVPYVVMAHGTGIVSSKGSNRNLNIAQIGLDNAEIVMTNSEFIAKQAINEFNLPKSKVEVVYLGIDPEEFKPTSLEEKEKIKEKYGCKGKKLVYTTGFFMEEKGFQDLIKAASIYEEKNDNIVTLISGKGPNQEVLEKQIKDLKLKRTKIIGWIPKEDLLSLYAAADIVVMPSRWDEPFGLVTIEAMSSGTPVIGTNAGGTPEIIEKGTGILVKPKNPGEMAEAVMGKIDDNDWLIKSGEKARELVKKKFYIGLMCKNTEKVYDRVLG